MESRRTSNNVFITGGTGYVGSRLISRLIQSCHHVRALVRPGSEAKLPQECEPVFGDALRAESFQDHVRPNDVFVQLVGVPHPSPSRAKEFQSIDLVSVRASVAAATRAGVNHFVYVSVAHPAPVMKEYIKVRSEGEELIRQSGMDATILRPWYVLGPGHRWPYAMIPVYAILERIPSTRESARRLGLVSIDQMVSALAQAVQSPVQGVRVLEVPDIKQLAGKKHEVNSQPVSVV